MRNVFYFIGMIFPTTIDIELILMFAFGKFQNGDEIIIATMQARVVG